MTYKEVAAMVASVGVPYAYYQFPDGTEVAPPFICFWFDRNNDFIADSRNYQKIEHLRVEVYSDNKNYSLEAVTEAALTGAGLVWVKTEGWLDSERMMMVLYECDVLITEENNG